MAELKKGDIAPDFKLEDQDGNRVELSDFKGKKLLVYFYPKADTPGCTKQACSVRDAQTDLDGSQLNVIGISPDQPKKQKKFDEKYGLKFPLLSDADHAVAEAYGAWGEKSMYGKKYMGIIRSSILIDEQGKVVDTWYKVKREETVPRALESVQ
jgi:peroxiredoxin Q/BCP